MNEATERHCVHDRDFNIDRSGNDTLSVLLDIARENNECRMVILAVASDQ